MENVSITVKFKEFLHNRKKGDAIRDTIFKTKRYEEWLAQFYLLADTQFHAFGENQKILNSILDEFYNMDAPHEKYEELLCCVKMLQENEYYDPGLEEEFLSILIPYFEFNVDEDTLIYLYGRAGYIYMELSRTGDYDFGEVAIGYFDKLIAFRNHQKAMENPDNLIFVILGYANLFGSALSLNLLSYQKAYEYWKELRIFLERPAILQMQKKNEAVKNYCDFCQGVFPRMAFGIYKIYGSSEEGIYPILLELAKHQYFDRLVKWEDVENPYKDDFYLYHFLCVEVGNENPEKAFWEMDSFFREHFDSDSKTNDLKEKTSLGQVLNAITFIVKMLQATCLPVEEKKRIVLGYTNQILQIANLFQDGESSFFLNSALNSVAENELFFSFFETPEQKLYFLTELTIKRQIFTLIHSTMVSTLAALIMESIIDHKPEILLKGSSFDGVETIVNTKDTILQFTKDAAKFHDIGKSAMIDIINISYRKLTESEAIIIKNHPKRGLDYLKVDPYFERFHDVILGHHKFYDGKGGYETSFDNTKSEYRFLIDLVTICDCMDAATDYLARNFRNAKTFEQLFRELEKGAGVVYNPDIVAFVKEHAELYDELKHILGPGRTEIYYKIYQDYL